MPPNTSIQGVKVFYGPFETDNPDYGLVPGPKININYSPIYANDSVIGLTNKITLNGYVSRYIQQTILTSNSANNEAQFTTQVNDGPSIVSTESGNIGITSENDKIIILEVGQGSVTSRYLRFTPLKRRDNSLDNIYRINEFRILYQGELISLSGSTISSIGYNGTPLSNLIDNNDNTTVYPFSNPIIIEFDQAKLFDSYNFVYVNTSIDSENFGQAPIRWTLEGSDDGILWTMIDDQSLVDVVLADPLPSGSPDTPTSTSISSINPPIDDGTDSVWEVTNASESQAMNIRETISNIDKVKSLLNKNGSVLTIRDSENTVILTAIGGVLKSLSFDMGNNSWTQTLPFTAEIEFNHINFFGEDLACNSYWENNGSNNLIDINNYPLKSFTENWSIVIDNESFNYLHLSDVSGILRIANNTINLTYNISATGKDYYTTNDDPPEFKPSWEIAKHFVQERLYDKVTSLISGILIMSDSGCSIIDNDEGLLSGLESGIYKYQVFNETINCSFSETEGSFDATYQAILKKQSDNGQIYDNNAAKHTITKTINHSRSNGSNARLSTDISLNGTIEGLILGGLIRADKNSFRLPKNGSLLIKDVAGSTKYDNARALWDQIQADGTDDIGTQFKTVLGITNEALGISGSCNTASPYAKSFNLTHNFIDGNITYDITYDSECMIFNSTKTQVVQNVAINFVDKTPVFAEFIIPDIGTVLQDIKTWTGKEIEFTITGRDEDLYKINQSFTTFPINWLQQKIALPISPPSISHVREYDVEYGYILKSRSLNFNPIDGTYNMKLVYSCTQGCPI